MDDIKNFLNNSYKVTEAEKLEKRKKLIIAMFILFFFFFSFLIYLVNYNNKILSKRNKRNVIVIKPDITTYINSYDFKNIPYISFKDTKLFHEKNKQIKDLEDRDYLLIYNLSNKTYKILREKDVLICDSVQNNDIYKKIGSFYIKKDLNYTKLYYITVDKNNINTKCIDNMDDRLLTLRYKNQVLKDNTLVITYVKEYQRLGKTYNSQEYNIELLDNNAKLFKMVYLYNKKNNTYILERIMNE